MKEHAISSGFAFAIVNFTMHDDESEDDHDDGACDGNQDDFDGGSHDYDSHNFIRLRIILFRYEIKKEALNSAVVRSFGRRFVSWFDEL